MIEQNYFSQRGAEGETLVATERDAKANDWSQIAKGSLSEAIFSRVCPSDGT